MLMSNCCETKLADLFVPKQKFSQTVFMSKTWLTFVCVDMFLLHHEDHFPEKYRFVGTKARSLMGTDAEGVGL